MTNIPNIGKFNLLLFTYKNMEKVTILPLSSHLESHISKKDLKGFDHTSLLYATL